MNKKFIFATDVDGTLLMDNGQIHPETLEAFKHAYDTGHINVIATGRSLINTETLLELMPYTNYFVCNNGALIFDVKNQKTIYIKGVNPSHYIPMLNFAKKYNASFKVHTNSQWFGINNPSKETGGIKINDEIDAQIRNHINSHPEDDKLFNGSTPTQMSILSSPEFCQEYISHFTELFGQDCSVYLTNAVYIDVNPKNKSKWTGLQEIAHQLEISHKDIVAFGDSGNDLEMLVGAKHNGYALENSKDDLKAVVKPKIGSNNTNAIGTTIMKYLRGEHDK